MRPLVAEIAARIGMAAVCVGHGKANVGRFGRDLEFRTVDRAADLVGKDRARGFRAVDHGDARGEGCDIEISWGDSANVYNLWAMTATLEGGELRYSDCVSTVRTYETEEKFTDEVQSENGAGRFYFDGEQNLIWETEGADEGIAFMKVG